MKLLLLLVVVAVIGIMLTSRRRADRVDRKKPEPGPLPGDAPAAPVPPARMVACAHCQLHLPQVDAQSDASGQFFCSEAHRLAGPR